jgi:hypothetical protein
MEGKITRVRVTWTDHTANGARSRFYNVLPGGEKIIRPERMEELVDDLTVVCEQLQAARDGKTNGTTVAGPGRTLRRIK